ncbi:hypothetical protein ACFL6I_00315 [candidate division KSB1 bacterium]
MVVERAYRDTLLRVMPRSAEMPGVRLKSRRSGAVRLFAVAKMAKVIKMPRAGAFTDDCG